MLLQSSTKTQTRDQQTEEIELNSTVRGIGVKPAMGFRANNKLEAALHAHKEAYELAKKQNSAYTDFYKQQLIEIEGKLPAKQK